MMISPTEMLEEEYLVIQKVINAPGVIVEKMEEEHEVDFRLIEDVLEFKQIFVGDCHYGKEEDALFPLLIEWDVPENGCPVVALASKDKRSRKFINSLAEGLSLLQAGDAGGRLTVIHKLQNSSVLYPNHIWK